MKKIVVASLNPVKIKAALKGFQRMFKKERFEIMGISVASHVSDQPNNNAETFLGALNRANNALESTSADYYVGIEGGVEDNGSDMEAYAWIVIKANDGAMGKAKTGSFFLPPPVAKLIKQGKELGEADDIIFGRTNSKQANGAIGLLTNNVMVRCDYYTEAVVLALIPFKNKKLYNLS